MGTSQPRPRCTSAEYPRRAALALLSQCGFQVSTAIDSALLQARNVPNLREWPVIGGTPRTRTKPNPLHARRTHWHTTIPTAVTIPFARNRHSGSGRPFDVNNVATGLERSLRPSRNVMEPVQASAPQIDIYHARILDSVVSTTAQQPLHALETSVKPVYP